MRAAAPQPSGDDTPPPSPAPRAISDTLASRAPPAPIATQPPSPRIAAPPVTVGRDLPPDTPLEPGTTPPNRKLSPSERVAASESAIGDISPSAPQASSGSASFIAAARRAAQAAAAAAPTADKPNRATGTTESLRAMAKSSSISSKIRSLLVGASVVVIVLGSVKMAMTLLDAGARKPVAARSTTAAPATGSASRANPATTPLITSPTPIDRQSANMPAPGSAISAQPDGEADADDDTTGAISPAGEAVQGTASSDAAPAPVSTSETLPDALGGPQLRAAALKGDPAAAYEVALRFAEGKGVPVNLDEAAKWYARSAQAGIVPAMFRLGTFYEKGLGVKKNVDTARRYYLMAAEHGNAKAMHNLAVLDADGGGKGADYKSAALWFRKAAERGVTDSQFNLAILYARGIGVPQNLPESFKWFSLAAAHGDVDSSRKRDEVAKQLDAQSLAAAKLAVANFKPEPQPDDAINVATPAGGWDATPVKGAAAKPPHAGRTHSARATR
jgi:localization factor PodJL